MRRSLAAIYFTVLLFVTGCQPPGPKALLQGEQLMRAGKYTEAIPPLQKAAELLPGNAQAWNHLGLAYQYAGQPDNALKAYQQAVSLDRNLPAIRFNLGNLHLEQGRLNEAATELTTATVLEPKNTVAFVQLGKAHLRARRIDDAERTFVQALRLDPNNVEALNYYGVVQLHRRKSPNALGAFNEALKQDPTYAPAVLNQAMLYHHYVINKPTALAKYKEYLQMNPDATGAATANEAVRALEAELAPKPVAIAQTNPVPTLTNRPVAVVTNPPATNRIAATIQSSPPPVQKPATNVAIVPPPQTNKAVAAFKTNEPAAKTIVTVMTNLPTAPPKTNEIKVAAVPPPSTNATPPTVEKPADKPIEKPIVKAADPEPVKPLEVVNVDEDAIVIAPAKDLPKPAATKAEPPKPPVQVATKTTPITAPVTNKVEEPPPLIRPVEREEKSSSILKKANPLNWFKRGEKEPATEKEVFVAKRAEPKADLKTLPDLPPAQPQPQPETAPQIEPEPVYARYPYRRATLPNAGNREAAIPAFNNALKAHQEGKLGTAMDGYRHALRIDPRLFEAQLNLGIAAASANDLSLALASLEDAVRLDSQSPEARYQFAIVLRRANYPLDAVNELKTILEQSPTQARAHLALANLYAQVMNKAELAIPHYRKTLELAPDHPQAPEIRSWLAQH